MKKALCTILITALFSLAANAAPPITIKDPYYTFQAGVSAGVNIAGDPVNGSGFHVGGMMRWGNHVLGGIYERERNDHNGFTRYRADHTKRGGYYSFTFPMEHFQWGPMIGVGQLNYHYHEISGGQYINVVDDNDTYFEIAIYGIGGARGNGIGGKVFFLSSAIEKYVGFTLFVQAGWAWNKKS